MTDTREEDNNDSKRLRGHKLLEVFTHTDYTLTHETHEDTYKHTQHLVYCVYLSMDAPHYMVPQVLSPCPADQLLHELPYHPN